MFKAVLIRGAQLNLGLLAAERFGPFRSESWCLQQKFPLG